MRTGTTPAGLRYAVRRSGRAVACCALCIRCGTRDEAGFPAGIAHFTEHCLFKGTRRKSAAVINGYLDRLGGELNAYTTKEEIVLHATVLKEDLPKALSLLLELATQPSFPEGPVATEQGVVLDEILSVKDAPAEAVYDRFEELLFAGHPLGSSILGSAASVRKIRPEQLRRFVAERFTPERMALTVVADVDEALLERKLRRLSAPFFAEREAHSEAAQPVKESPPPPAPFHLRREKRHHEVNAVLGGLAPSLYAGKERYAAVLLANILGGPAANARLNTLLRERHGWVYGVECNYSPYADTGVIAISFGCERAKLDRCLDLIRRELDSLCSTPLSDRKLKAARKQLFGQLAISSESAEAQCLSMGKSLLAYGRIASMAENRALLEALSAEDLRALAEKLFDPARLSSLVYL